MYELTKIGKLFTSKFVGTGPSSYEKGIYQAAVSRRLRNTALHVSNKWLFIIRRLFVYTQHTVFYHASMGGVQPLTRCVHLVGLSHVFVCLFQVFIVGCRRRTSWNTWVQCSASELDCECVGWNV